MKKSKKIETLHEYLGVHNWKYFDADNSYTAYRVCEECKSVQFRHLMEENSGWSTSQHQEKVRMKDRGSIDSVLFDSFMALAKRRNIKL